MDKRWIFLVLFGFLFIFSTPVFALNSFSVSVSPNSTMINNSISVYQLFNFTVNNSDSAGKNITELNITWPSRLEYVSASAHQTAENLAGYIINNTVRFLNTTPSGFVNNTTLQYFWFNLSSTILGVFNFTVNMKDTAGDTNTTNVSFEVIGVIAPNLPASREFGNQTVSLNCSVRSNSTLGNLGNITLQISNLSFYNQSSGDWSDLAWNIINITNVAGVQNSTLNTTTLYGNYSDFYKYIFKCEVNNTSNNYLFTTPNISFIVSMRNFSGYVKNFTDNVTSANVSIYRFIENTTGPPTETLVASNLTGSDGSFIVTNVNTTRTCTASGDTNVTSPMQCQPMFRIKIAYNNSSGFVTQMGPSLPAFSREMIFGPEQTYQCPPGAPADMRCGPPMINGSILYTQPAATLNITAINSTGDSVNFGYEIVDQSLGYSIESNIRANISSVNVTVPIDRNYTVMVVRDPMSFPSDPSYCSPGIMNVTHCASPPISNLSIGTLTQGSIVNVVMNLNFGDYNLTGCINVTGNDSAIYITKVVPKLVPWSGFVPPMKAEIESFNYSTNSSNLNYSDSRCPNSLAYYSLHVMGSASGINYFIEFYGKNASSDSATPDVSNVSVAAFQNFTIYNNTHPGSFNITLRPLAGSYQTGGDVNTSKTIINLFKNTGNKTVCNAADTSGTINCTVLSNPHIEADVKDSNIYNGQNVHYIIEELSNGSFKLPFLNTSTVKVSIFEQGSSPIKKTLNLSQNINNITIYSFMPEKILPNGTKVEFNKTDEGMMQNIRFYKSNSTCNVYNPPEDCALEGGNFSGATFDPMRAMLAGKSNLRITTPNITLYLINVDLLASGPPEPDRSESALSGSTALQMAWRFGSMAPKIYDYVLIGVNDSSINSSWSYNMGIPVLFDENWNVVWNLSAGNTSASVPEDYTDYNATTSAYSDFLTSAGMSCSFTNSSKECYINASESKFWLKIPHFSGIQPTISGTAPTAAVTTITSLTTLGETLVGKKGEATVSIASVQAGKMANVTVSKIYEVDIRQINISVVNTVSNIRIIINKLPGLPADVTQEIVGKVYHHINITKRNIEDTDMSKVYIKFAVNRSWITDNNVDSTTIRLYRWVNGQWNALATSKVSEDTNETFYQAESLGLSYFAIGGQEIGAAPPPTECVEDWSCPDWTTVECINGTQTRTCTDLNDCGTTVDKPAESQDCEVGVAEVVGLPAWTIATIISVIIIIAGVIIIIVFIQRKKTFTKKKSSKKKVEYYYSK